MLTLSHRRLGRFAVSLVLTAMVALTFAAQPAAAQDNSGGADDEPGTTPVSGRQPIIENQFSTTSGGALQLRRPGLYIQQGFSVNQGNGQSFFTGVPEDEPGWVRETVDNVAIDFINMFTDLFGGLQYLVQQWSGSSGSSSSFVPISNAVTTGQGTTTQIQ